MIKMFPTELPVNDFPNHEEDTAPEQTPGIPVDFTRPDEPSVSELPNNEAAIATERPPTVLSSTKNLLIRVFRWQYIWLVLMVVATLAMHFAIITNPGELILDEQHYVKDARVIIEEQHTNINEHPPLAKLMIVAGIKMFGDNPWGWRFFPVLFGTGSIVLFFFICRRLEMSPFAVNLATFLLAFENMTFTQASVAMLDVFFLTFILASFLLYLSRRFILSGATIGLGALAKLTGALALPTIVIHWIFSRWPRSWKIILTILVSAIVFTGVMPIFDSFITGNFSEIPNPLDRIQTMLSLSGSLKFSTVEHEALSRPWEWIITYRPMPYWYNPNYTAAVSPSVWVFIMPVFLYMVVRGVRGHDASLFGAAWFIGTGLLWIPASIITDRVSFLFYFYPSIGAICLGLGLVLSQLIDVFRQRQSGKLKWTALGVVALILLVHIASFVILAPVFVTTLFFP